jgi:hypothetical protein
MSMLLRSFFLFLVLALSACEAEWDDRARQSVFSECLKKNKDKSSSDRQRYCSCFTQRVEKEYKSPEILEADPTLFNSLVFDCKDTARAFVMDWPDSVKDKFMSTCLEAAIWRNMKDPPSYCLCLMERSILAMHGNRAGDGMANSSIHGSVSAIGIDCQKANPANIDSIMKVAMPKNGQPETKIPGVLEGQTKPTEEVQLNPF